MPDFSGLVEVIKQASLDAVNAAKPTSVVFGKVLKINPLEIKVDEKTVLGEQQLILTRNVTEYTVEMTVEHETEDETDHTHTITVTCANCPDTATSKATSHKHEYKGKKEFTVHNALGIDEEVIMIQILGGQKFVVIDRLEKEKK